MKHKRVTLYYILLFTVALLMILTSIFHTSRQINQDVNSEMQNTLHDVANQNAVIVYQEIKDKFDLLYSIADTSDPASFEDLSSIKQYCSFVDIY